MTRAKAERLTGYEIRRLETSERDGCVAYGAFRDNQMIAEGANSTDDIALKILVREVYSVHSYEAFRRFNWRCARCRRGGRLQIHHRKYRSHGGTHRIENLEPVCWNCHRLIHQLERSL